MIQSLLRDIYPILLKYEKTFLFVYSSLIHHRKRLETNVSFDKQKPQKTLAHPQDDALIINKGWTIGTNNTLEGPPQPKP